MPLGACNPIGSHLRESAVAFNKGQETLWFSGALNEHQTTPNAPRETMRTVGGFASA